MLQGLLLLALQGATSDGWQASGPPPAEHQAEARLVLEGSVLDPDGAPAPGAVVVSSAGGRAVVDASGRYRLELQLPSAARQLQVTAVGAGGSDLLASTEVQLSVLAGPFDVVSVAPLWLAQGGACSPSWLPTFGPAPGVFGTVHALVAFDDGSGTALYAGGAILGAGAAAAGRVVKWDGEGWSAVGTGPVPFIAGSKVDTVYCLEVFDDGTGPALYAGGDFLTMGGVTAHRVAKWDGTSWSALGAPTSTDYTVLDLAVFDDGTGAALYAAGEFRHVGGVPADFIARWDGATWTPVGGGMNNTVVALQVTTSVGGGPLLHAAGYFTRAGGAPANRVAAWNGSTWTPLGTGMDGPVRDLIEFDDGGGPTLYAGGAFTTADGLSASNIARWDGSSWSALTSGTDDVVHALAVFDDGTGSSLHVAGEFTVAGGVPARGVARWNGSAWSALGLGMEPPVRELAVVDVGSGARLYAGGESGDAGGVALRNIASWDGSSWQALGGGLIDMVSSLAVFDDGSGAALYAGGLFTSIGGTPFRSIAKWDGSSWSPLGIGVTLLSGAEDGVTAMAVFDDGNGPALYVGGDLLRAGNIQAARRIARWDGATWSALGSGMVGTTTGDDVPVRALTVFDDGSGPALYACGDFTSAGGVSQTSRIARWNGSTWSSVGGGLSSRPESMVVFDDGTGPALYVASGGVRRWNGATWSILPSTSLTIHALAVFDDGDGPALYAGGDRLTANLSSVIRWDGVSWSDVGTGLTDVVRSMAAFDDGEGPALFVGGWISTAGGLPANNVAKWNGSAWTGVGSGLVGTETRSLVPAVRSFAVFQDRKGPGLFVGGNLFGNPDAGDSFLSRWGRPDTLAPVLDCPPPLSVLDPLGSSPGEFVSFAIAAADDIDPTPELVCEPPSGSFFLRGTTIVSCTATDASGNQSTCEFAVTVRARARVPEIEPSPRGR